MGEAAAASTILFILIFFLTLFFLKVLKKGDI
jgi:ABC-type sugar transport system permease subunit